MFRFIYLCHKDYYNLLGIIILSCLLLSKDSKDFIGAIALYLVGFVSLTSLYTRTRF
jgi:hypothetical protein